MKTLSLVTSVLLVLSALISCNALSLSISFPNPIKNYINELKDQIRDNENYNNFQNIERDIIFNSGRTLDVYYDKENTSELKPVFLFIFGGSWYSGSKVKFTKFGSLLEENDYVAVLPNYVLFPKGGFEDMVDDIYQSIQWTYKNIEKYGGDPNRISISAYSAGSHLTALTIFKSLLGYPNKGEILEPLPMLEKVVLLNGPYDFDDYSIVRKFLGKETENSVVENIVKLVFQSKNVSPTDLFKPFADGSLESLGAKKFTLFYTSLDETVVESSALNLMKQMNRVSPNVDISYVYKEGYEHTTVTRGVRAGSSEEEEVFINLISL
ncbi:alpha/beta-hydrolase [Piromyces finnis]|uniref:Alpha/beta-hydrolase n=1 Tax=Piromyces finnis TaxID=1754191 RepID=A0A1Y1VIV7_9FUNG|nr:alpha/beta-hydrolase [Piromyces finnis]|eukprot:ORX57268.1 alpha/beta-hydrolase [Piromyces finnis]